MTLRLRRSELATPGSSEKMIARGASSDADLVFLDLEDAVAPAQKETAREMTIEALNGLDWGKTPPPPPLPAEVVATTSARYIDAYERITGRSFADWPGAGS